MSESNPEVLLTRVEDRRRFRVRRSGMMGSDERRASGINAGLMDGEPGHST
jgi:hypothetical protein